MKLIIRWLITASALFVAAMIVPGVEIADSNGWVAVGIMAMMLGLVNAVIRPILVFFSCPLIILTLGLFTLVINALVFWMAAWVANFFGAGFFVDGFLAAFFGSIVASIVSVLLSIFVSDDRKE